MTVPGPLGVRFLPNFVECLAASLVPTCFCKVEAAQKPPHGHSPVDQ